MSDKCGNSFCPPLTYCFQDSCVACFDCAIYNRLPPSNGCAKQSDECGSCLIGFYEVPVTTVLSTKPCEQKNASLQESSVEFHKSQINIELICGLLMFAIICITYLFVTKNKSKNSNCHSVLHLPSLHRRYRESHDSTVPDEEQPPTYHSVQEESACNQLYSFTVNSVQKNSDEEFPSVHFVRDERQSAKMYRAPTAPYYWQLFEVEDQQNESPDQVDGEQRPSSSRQSTNSQVPSNEDSGAPSEETPSQSGAASNSYSSDTVTEETVRNEPNPSRQNEFGP